MNPRHHLVNACLCGSHLLPKESTNGKRLAPSGKHKKGKRKNK